MNQTPTRIKPLHKNPNLRRIKTFQFIDIFEKAGLMNQTPTEEKPHQ
ncbi:hypothetical protein LCGC14_0515880 [marine sediment metagenome]|uniref:Uncharacterized protein n=1 Tax=marine sediment metagenome TaxID=412755 RepID=A0A0F9ULE8_9ZZZZ